MFDNILGKTENAMVQLSKALSGFEQEYVRLKNSYENQLNDIKKNYEGDFQVFINTAIDTINCHKKNYDEFINQHRLDMSKIIIQQNDHLKEMISLEYQKFSDNVKEKIEEIYAIHEIQMKKIIEQSFESDLIKIFEKYGDKLGPIVTKLVLKNLFKIGKK